MAQYKADCYHRLLVFLAAYKRAFIKMPQYQSILPDKATLVNKTDGLNVLYLSPTANKGQRSIWVSWQTGVKTKNSFGENRKKFKAWYLHHRVIMLFQDHTQNRIVVADYVHFVPLWLVKINIRPTLNCWVVLSQPIDTKDDIYIAILLESVKGYCSHVSWHCFDIKMGER